MLPLLNRLVSLYTICRQWHLLLSHYCPHHGRTASSRCRDSRITPRTAQSQAHTRLIAVKPVRVLLDGTANTRVSWCQARICRVVVEWDGAEWTCGLRQHSISLKHVQEKFGNPVDADSQLSRTLARSSVTYAQVQLSPFRAAPHRTATPSVQVKPDGRCRLGAHRIICRTSCGDSVAEGKTN